MINKSGVGFKVLEILEENPSIPYSTIGDMVGVTRERVRQIAQKNGYPPRNGALKLKPCPICGKDFSTRNLYCSLACSHNAMRNRIVVNCHQCGETFERRPGAMRSKSGKYFCSRVCFGKWTGKTNSKASKYIKPIIGNLEHEIGSREELPLNGKVLSPEIMELFDALLCSSENNLIQVRKSNKHKLRKLGIAIKRQVKGKG